eukprot:161908-Lingulodinium_polyedra.AAC.1
MKALATMQARTTRTVFLAQPRPATAAAPEAWPVDLATDQTVQGVPKCTHQQRPWGTHRNTVPSTASSR